MILLGFDDDGTPRTRKPRRRDHPCAHLLTHTSGFSYDLFKHGRRRAHMEHEGCRPSRRRMPTRPCARPLLFEPGERWEYGSEIDWAGKIVESVSGRKLERYLRDEFFGPLGMRGHELPASRRHEPAARRRNAAPARRRDRAHRTSSSLRTPTSTWAAEGSSRPGPDYLRFTRMLLGGGALDGARVLAAETVKKMGENAIGDVAVPRSRATTPRWRFRTSSGRGRSSVGASRTCSNTEDVAGGRAAGSWTWAGRAQHVLLDPTRARRRTGGADDAAPACERSEVIDTLEKFERAVYAR